MLEFKVIEKLKPNKGLTDILKDLKYKVKLGQIKTILHTNPQVIIPIEIKRDKNYNIDIKDIKFTDEFITKSSKEYLKYLNKIMNDNNIGIKFHKEIDEIELKNMESNYDILSIMKMKNKEYSNKFLEEFITKSQEHLYIDGIVSCPYTEKNVIKDILILVPKNELINTI